MTAPRGLSSLPHPAQAAISAVLGRDQSAYHAVEREGGLYAENPKHALRADFTRDGIRIRTGAQRWGLSFSGYGYGGALGGGTAVAPKAKANRVEYRRGDLTEWWVNGPLGLEQGFTLARAPGKRTGEPLSFLLTLSGDLTAALEPSGDGVRLSRADGTVALRYSGLIAHDAAGRELRAWLTVHAARLSLRVDDTEAQYPVVVDPFVQQAHQNQCPQQNNEHSACGSKRSYRHGIFITCELGLLASKRIKAQQPFIVFMCNS